MKHTNLLTAFLLLILSTLTANAQHDYVDLGLPSGTLWATTNVGAINPADYGDYFAWGETEPKSDYIWSTYKWCKGTEETLTKYCNQSNYGYNGFTDVLTELKSEDDAATANWGREWQMPSEEQFEELINSDYTTIEWTAKTGKEGFLNYGMLITSNTNGNSIFLPASGRFEGDAGLKDVDINVSYWSRSLEKSRASYYLYAHYQYLPPHIYNLYRSFGFSVRPVRVEQKEYDYVDLGLPSGTLWATCNVGASSPEERGDYFACGETEPKDYYDLDTYKWCNGSWKALTKYCTESGYGYNGFTDGLTELLPEDDAATVNWGAPWHMPSRNQIDELLKNCTREITQRNSVRGWLFTGPNGGQIFLPACGYRSGNSYVYPNSDCAYWSRSIDKTTNNYASILYSEVKDVYLSGFPRGAGLSVRAVREPDTSVLIVENIILDLTSVSLLIDEKRTITAIVRPATAANKNVIWSSNNTSVATVDQSGEVTAKAIGSCTITCSATDGSGVKAECQVTVTTTNSETINGRDYVDLGLPSGTLWATCNVGANSPVEYGDYFAWGETEPKSDYNWDTYQLCNGSGLTITKYYFDDGLKELFPEDDAATANWGSEWQMPNEDQFSELLNSEYTIKVWTTLKGVEGYKFTSKVNGNSIFMPAAGNREGTSLNKEGSYGYYWTRSLSTNSGIAYKKYFSKTANGGLNENRCYGNSVRPVRASEPEVYTEFVEATGTLTYYYDNLRTSRSGVTEPYDLVNYPKRFKGYNEKVLKAVIDPSMKNAHLISMQRMFNGVNDNNYFLYLRNLRSIEGLENLNTENVTDMTSMFLGCKNLTSLDLSSFNTANVTDMRSMFNECSKLTSLNLSSFNTANVTSMINMFLGCSNLTTIFCDNDWSGNAADSENMFDGCYALMGGKGTKHNDSFTDKTYARPDGGPSTPGYFTLSSDKKEVYTEFVEATGILTYYYDGKREVRAGVTEPYDPVNASDVARFTGYFKKVVKAVVDPSMKDAPLTSMRSMFYGGMNPETWVMQSLRNMTTIEGLENLNTATVTDMNSMFAMCEKLTTLDLSTFNTSNVTTFNGMFTSCDNLELVDVTSFDISKVTDMEMMFISCPKLTTICCFNDWSTSSAKSNYMFSGCKSLVGDKGTVFDGNVIDKTYARPDGGTSKPGYFTSDTMTGIKEMKNEERRIKNDIYNLSGQRLQKLQKGINIIGGKKVVIK